MIHTNFRSVVICETGRMWKAFVINLKHNFQLTEATQLHAVLGSIDYTPIFTSNFERIYSMRIDQAIFYNCPPIREDHALLLRTRFDNPMKPYIVEIWD